MSKTYKLELTEEKAKELFAIGDLAIKAERLNTVVQALLNAPSDVPEKVKVLLALVKEVESTPVQEDR